MRWLDNLGTTQHHMFAVEMIDENIPVFMIELIRFVTVFSKSLADYMFLSNKS